MSEAELRARRKGGAEEGKAGAGITVEDDDAAGLACGAAEHGQPRVSGLAAGPGQQGQKPADKLKNARWEYDNLIN
jgi:hypothetical protein